MFILPDDESTSLWLPRTGWWFIPACLVEDPKEVFALEDLEMVGRLYLPYFMKENDFS